MKTRPEDHSETIQEDLKQRFSDRPVLVAWLYTCLEVKIGRPTTKLDQEGALKALAETNGCVDFQEWIEAASQALDDAFLQEHAHDEAFVEKGCARIRKRQKRLYPWRSQTLEEHRPTYLEGDDVDFPSNEEN